MTGVQTCALPISGNVFQAVDRAQADRQTPVASLALNAIQTPSVLADTRIDKHRKAEDAPMH